MIDLLLRGVAIGSLLAIFASTLRNRAANAPLWTFRLFCLGATGFLVFGSAEISALIGPVRHVMRLLSAGGVGYFWLFAMALFSRHPLRIAHAVPILAMTAIALPGPLLSPAGQLGTKIVYNMIEILLVGHVMIEIWRNRTDDLVNARFALRFPFMVVIGIVCLILTGFKFAGLIGFPHHWLMELQAAATAFMALAGASAFTQERPRLFESAAVPKPSTEQPAPAMTPSDQHLMTRLFALVEETGFWRQPGLTIGVTAEKLGVPEYRLRQLINRNLGYRNFSDFLNERRVTLAKVELQDPEKARVQISTIAFDLGYASLGPFNRAFRDATGMSPRQWRGAVCS